MSKNGDLEKPVPCLSLGHSGERPHIRACDMEGVIAYVEQKL